MITVKEAREKILSSTSPLDVEKKHILESLGYIIAEDVYSDINIPPFDNSQMDGFAVITDDVKEASQDNPVTLQVIESLPAGYIATQKIASGQAIRIMTGAMIPEGADAVVMVEYTQTAGDRVKIFAPVKKGQHIRCAGNSVKNGDLVIPRSKEIRPSEMAMLASMNRAEVMVYKRPRVALISTGDELTPLGGELKAGKIRDSNRYGLYGQVLEIGCCPIDMGIVKDQIPLLEEKFSEALSLADVLVTSGGVSVGDYDIVKDVLSKFGEINFWKVAMKPGKPQAFGIAEGKPVFGLPGNPVSSLVVFELMVRPALLKMAGHADIFRPIFKAVLGNDVRNTDNRVHYARAIIKRRNDKFYAQTTGPQGSGILYSMVLANGLIVIPIGADLKAGDEVDALLMDDRRAFGNGS